MSKLDDIERLARTSERLTILTPFTTLQMIEVIRAAAAMRKAGTNGVWSNGRSLPTEEATAFDAALAKLESWQP